MGYRESNAHGWLEVNADDGAEARTSLGALVEKGDLSEDQKAAFDQIDTWLSDTSGKQVLTLGGYAGTGKTTLVSLIARSGKLRSIAFCAYTGKAANVLGQKLRVAGVDPLYCGTIHRLIYDPEMDEKTGAVLAWSRVDSLPYDLIVVDEASMVDDAMFEDLKSYRVPILAVGDHGQLPPVKGQFNLMMQPDVRLERIHRQAEGNPIIRLSVAIRERGLAAIPINMVYPMQNVGGMFTDLFRDADRTLSTAMLCFTNKKRTAINIAMRRALFDDVREVLLPNDLVVCLKNTRFGTCDFVFNGMRGVVTKVLGLDRDVVSIFEDGKEMFDYAKSNGRHVRARIMFPDDKLLLQARLNVSQFGREKTISSFADAGLPEYSSWSDVGMLFDHGYCLTAHKAQGSEFADVAVVLEGMSFMDEDFQRRWYYTAVTRASQRLYLVRP